MHILRWHLVLVMLLWMPVVLSGKDKIVKKRPIAVTDPWSVRSLEEWINLGELVLKKSCVAANLCQTGSIITLARRLFNFYNELSSAQQGMRVYLLFGILLTLFYLRLRGAVVERFVDWAVSSLGSGFRVCSSSCATWWMFFAVYFAGIYMNIVYLGNS